MGNSNTPSKREVLIEAIVKRDETTLQAFKDENEGKTVIIGNVDEEDEYLRKLYRHVMSENPDPDKFPSPFFINGYTSQLQYLLDHPLEP